MNIIYQNDIYIMILESISYTKEFDIKKNSRSFCNLDMTYSQVIGEVLKSYNRKSYIDTVSHEKVIDDFLLQYEETDWEFLKRLATHFNSILLADCTTDFGRVYFGLPNIKSNKILTINDYTIITSNRKDTNF